MNKEALIALGLTEEQADKVLAFFAGSLTEATKDLIPKGKFDELTTERSTLATSLADRDKQLATLKASAGSSEDMAALKQQLEDAIAKNKLDSEAAAKELAAYKKNNAVDLGLMKAGAKNPKAVKALLNLDKVSLDGENLIGLTDQLEAIRASDAYLFDDPSKLSGYETKAGSGGGGSGEPKDNPFKKGQENLTRAAELFAKDPELARKLAAAAGNVPAWMK